MEVVAAISFLAVLLALVSPAFANDPDMLQDVCVADSTSGTNSRLPSFVSYSFVFTF